MHASSGRLRAENVAWFAAFVAPIGSPIAWDVVWAPDPVTLLDSGFCSGCRAASEPSALLVDFLLATLPIRSARLFPGLSCPSCSRLSRSTPCGASSTPSFCAASSPIRYTSDFASSSSSSWPWSFCGAGDLRLRRCSAFRRARPSFLARLDRMVLRRHRGPARHYALHPLLGVRSGLGAFEAQ